MSKDKVKKLVNSFRKEYKLKTVSFSSLRAVAEKQGYTVVEYNHIYNDENVTALIESLGLTDDILRTRGFTYADSVYRIIFIHEDLSDAEKTVVLAHEEGHIYCGHLSGGTVIGRDVSEEYEANEFAHFLLNPSGLTKFGYSLRRHKKALIVCVAALALIAGGAAVWSAVKTESGYYGEYYVTETGKKYHEKDCIFVKNKDNVHRMTQEEYESGEYEPCRTCLP